MPEGAPAWDSLSEDQKKLYARFMEVYAGFMTQADEKVGELVQHLKDLGVYENTMIVLIGDNGATRDGQENGTFSFAASLSAGLIPTVDGMMSMYGDIGTDRMEALYPLGWGAVGNTPFNTYKDSTYGGALRNPLIISWPSGIEARGELRDMVFHVTDITPTVLDVLNIDTPDVLDGVEQMPMYGESRMDSFADPEAAGRDSYVTNLMANSAYYNDGWKIVRVHPENDHEPDENFDDDEWELFHVAEDYSESANVAADYPDKLAEMIAGYNAEIDALNIRDGIMNTGPQVMGFMPKGTPGDRQSFKYYPGVQYMSLKAAPGFGLNDVTITVPINRASAADEGVLAASGNEGSGWSLYIKDNKLVFMYNHFGEVAKIVSGPPVPVGESTVKIHLDTKAPNVGGPVAMFINDQPVGGGFAKTTILLTLEMFSIGKDSGGQVSPDYADMGEFPFSGEYEYVQFDTAFFPLNDKKAE